MVNSGIRNDRVHRTAFVSLLAASRSPGCVRFKDQG